MNSMYEFLMQRDILITAIIIAVLFIILAYRVVRGPRAIDRLVASCCIEVMIGIIMLLIGCYEEKSLFADLGLIIILAAFFGNLLISKYLEGRL